MTHPHDPIPGSCGKKTPWAELRLLDESGQKISTPEASGQIAIKMVSRFSSYWKQPEQTGKALRDGWYYPGDVCSVLMRKATGITRAGRMTC